MTHPSLLAPWGVNDINELLRPEPLRLEMGLSRSADGLLTVAVRTDLHGCKGRMLDWWFTFFETTQHINWWHPHDHVEHRGWDRHWKKGKTTSAPASKRSSGWRSCRRSRHASSFTPPRISSRRSLCARRATRRRSPPPFARASASVTRWRWMTTAIPATARCCTWCATRPMAACCAAASLLGKACANAHDELPDDIGFNLMRHCYNEFSYLAQFLPSLYYAENGREPAPLLW